MRDIKADMKAALIDEYEGYVRVNRTADAEGVAAVLKEQYSHDVAAKGDDSRAEDVSQPAPERADEGKPPENTAEPKSRRTARTKPAASGKTGD